MPGEETASPAKQGIAELDRIAGSKMSPRRVNPMRQMLVDSQKLALIPAEPEPVALPPAPEPEKPFDFEAYCLGTRATKITTSLKGRGYCESRHGRQFAEKIAHHLTKGELLEVEKLKEKYVFNNVPTYEQQMKRFIAELDAGQINRCGLF